ADEVADCVLFAVTRPPHVNIDEIVIKALAQSSGARIVRVGSQPGARISPPGVCPLLCTVARQMTLTILEGTTFCICDDRGDVGEETSGFFARDHRLLFMRRLRAPR